LEKVRRPVVAGYFYPGRRDNLIKMIEWSFTHRLGPGVIPSVISEKMRTSIGYIVPHAGYMYSGPIAAHAYYDMAQDGIPQSIIILGTNHTGLGKPVSVYPEGKWQTPLGYLEVDSELGEHIVEHSNIADFDEYAHLEEHSIEVQLPFIQYIYSDKVKIVPIVIGIHTPEAAIDIAESIVKAASELNRDIIILASSDFNHYESHDITIKKDEAAISRILELDTQGFYKILIDMNISICGPGGIMTLIEIAKRLKAKAILLKHATSGDISGDKTTVVGYTTIKFHRT
jgi:AmmeMemoRadiSam system protein B